MFEIVLTVCALADHAHCHDERYPVLDEDVTLIQCAMSILPALAQWQRDHPGWYISEWQCRPKRHEHDT